MMNYNEIDAVLERSKLRAGGGACGEVAIAINEILFDGKGSYVAAVNWALWKQGRLVGHVGVKDSAGVIWDAEGPYFEDDLENFLAWGMLDPEDPDWDISEEEAYDARIVRISKKKIRQLLPSCQVGENPHEILLDALE